MNETVDSSVEVSFQHFCIEIVFMQKNSEIHVIAIRFILQ